MGSVKGVGEELATDSGSEGGGATVSITGDVGVTWPSAGGVGGVDVGVTWPSAGGVGGVDSCLLSALGGCVLTSSEEC